MGMLVDAVDEPIHPSEVRDRLAALELRCDRLELDNQKRNTLINMLLETMELIARAFNERRKNDHVDKP